MNCGERCSPAEGVIDNEYLPSFRGEEKSNAPKSTYSFAHILALSLALTRAGRPTAILVKICWGYGSPKPALAGTPPIPEKLLSPVMVRTSSSTEGETGLELSGTLFFKMAAMLSPGNAA